MSVGGLALLAFVGGWARVGAWAAFVAVAAFGTLVAGLLLGHLGELFVTLALIAVLTALTALILETGAAFAEHAKIMVRILQIIFGLDPIARELRVARQAFVLFEQLGGVATLAIVLAVPRLSAEIWAPLSSAAAPAAALSLIDQMPTSLRSVFCPSAMGQQGRRQRRRLLTLSFRSLRACVWRSADCVGGGRGALYSFRGGAGPALTPM
jgi:hypothetical protein